ncbi:MULTISPECIES: hypothetical protein [unclassified Corynebacterium]|nr:MULTISPECIES: hypothetical protein [unclassified Corynebacterium]
MKFTLLGASAGLIMLLAGASTFFLPAYLILGIAIDKGLKPEG